MDESVRVLVACEFSGRVRDSFRELGHAAYSCDLIPCDPDGVYREFHIQANVLEYINEGWDLMIAHPPCTHLAVSGARYFKNKVQEQAEALQFVQQLMDAPIEKLCIENPVSVISSKIRKPDQIIQPWQFGEPEQKKTCLWLKNLPLLTPTNVLELPAVGYWNNQTPSGQNKLGPSPDRAKERGRTYWGIARAMASQWS